MHVCVFKHACMYASACASIYEAGLGWTGLSTWTPDEAILHALSMTTTMHQQQQHSLHGFEHRSEALECY